MISARALTALLAVLVPALAVAQPEPQKDIRAELASKIPGAKPEELRPSPIAGVYELMRGTDVAYVSTDGKYVIAGDLYDMVSNDNLTENRRRNVRLKLLQAVPESDMLVFSPQNPKETITVFTDIDCGYCRKLHSQIADYMKLGIRVRYLFYPRSGPDTESWNKAVEVWCAPNRNDALTRAKRGEELKTKPCGKSPIQRHYELGQEFALRGTPAIVTSTGELIPGLVEPRPLAQHLKDN